MPPGLRHVRRQNRPRIPRVVARKRDGRRDGGIGTMTANAEKAGRPPVSGWRLLSRVNDEFALIQLIVLALIIGMVAVPSFLSPANLVNILQQSSELSVLVLAEAIILIVGKFDLSLESIVGIAPMFAAWLVTSAALNGSGLMINPYLAVAII